MTRQLTLLLFSICFLKGFAETDVHWTWCGWSGGGWFWSSAADPVNPDVFYMGSQATFRTASRLWFGTTA